MKKILLIILLFATQLSKGQSFLLTTSDPTTGINWIAPATAAGYMNGITLLASKTSVSGAALATTALDYASGITLGTHSPVFAILKFGSGTTGISVVRIKTDGGYLVAATPMLTITSTDNNFILSLVGAVRNTGNISVEVTTAGLAASTVDVFVYGIKKL